MSGLYIVCRNKDHLGHLAKNQCTIKPLVHKSTKLVKLKTYHLSTFIIPFHNLLTREVYPIKRSLFRVLLISGMYLLWASLTYILFIKEWNGYFRTLRARMTQRNIFCLLLFSMKGTTMKHLVLAVLCQRWGCSGSLNSLAPPSENGPLCVSK